MRILVSRTDRLGDVLMTLPSLELLRRNLPEAEIDFLARDSVLPAIAPYLRERRIQAVGSSTQRNLFRGRYDAALLLSPEGRRMGQAWASRIPLRVGAFSRPTSFLFLNSGIRQKRTKEGRNEGEYGLDLACLLANRLGACTGSKDIPPVVIPVDEVARKEAQGRLASLGIEGRFVVVHPGTGGTAVNLSEDRYDEVLRRLEGALTWPVILTRGPSPIDQRIVSVLKDRERKRIALGEMRLDVFREVLRLASVVIGPSTGPLHLAHYAGTPTIGLYAPLVGQGRLRWTPWGGTGQVSVHTPDVQCPATRRCWGAKCSFHPCMDRAAWDGLILKDLSGLTSPCQ